MTIEKLRELHRAQPFRPFIIHLADGRSVMVRHPELLAASPTGRTVVVIEPDDSMHMIDLLLVTDLEVKANGRTKRRGS